MSPQAQIFAAISHIFMQPPGANSRRQSGDFAEGADERNMRIPHTKTVVYIQAAHYLSRSLFPTSAIFFDRERVRDRKIDQLPLCLSYAFHIAPPYFLLEER